MNRACSWMVLALLSLSRATSWAQSDSELVPRVAWALTLTGPAEQTTPTRGVRGGIMSLPRIARGVSADGESGAFVAGSFFGRCTLGNVELTSAGDADICVARLGPDGAVRWLKRFGGGGSDHAFDVATDPQGNCLVTGTIAAGAAFDEVATKTVGPGDAFVAKIDRSGKVVWVRTFGGTGPSGGNEICTDARGNVLVVSNAHGSLTVRRERFDRVGGMSCVVTKYSSDGELLWARHVASSGRVMGRGIATDAGGGVLVAGEFTGTMHADDQELTSADNRRDAFVARYDAEGQVQWARRIGAAADDYARGIGGATDGAAYVAGVADGGRKLFLAKLDARGKTLWRQGLLTTRGEGCEIEVDADGNSHLAGQFSRDIRIGDEHLTARGRTDLFVARFDASGKPVWTRHLAGDDTAASFAIALEKTGSLTIVGSFGGTLEFEDINLDARGRADSFIARLVPSARHEEE